MTNLCSDYHQLKTRDDDVSKIVFNPRYRHYEFLVMSFCLINALVVFIDLINQVFHSYLDWFVIVFIADILIHSCSREESAEHLRIAIQTSRDWQLYIKLSKYQF